MKVFFSMIWNLLFGAENSPRKTYSFEAEVQPPVVMPKNKPAKSSFIEKINPPQNVVSERSLIQKESEVGARIFGQNPYGLRRQFFNLDPSTWIWYDEYPDKQGRGVKSVTIRYEIHANGVLKVQEGARYDFIEGQELDNFVRAVEFYSKKITEEIYNPNLSVSPSF